MAVDLTRNTVYGLSQALLGVTNPPIISARNPTVNDRAALGQMWVNRTTAITYILSRIVANSYTWYATAAAAAAYTAVGLVTAGEGLVATSGVGTLTGAGLEVQANGASITGDTDIIGDLVTVGGDITAGTGLIATTGGLTVTAGGATITAGNLVVVAGTISTTVGNITAGAALAAATTVTAGTGLIATTGGLTVTLGGATIHGTVNINTADATATNIGRGGTGTLSMGNITADSTLWGLDVEIKLGDAAGVNSLDILDSADAGVAGIDSDGNIDCAGNITPEGYFELGAAGARIYSGAGDPAAVVPKGSLYIRLNADAVGNRLWIATDAAGTWTNFTTAA